MSTDLSMTLLILDGLDLCALSNCCRRLPKIPSAKSKRLWRNKEGSSGRQKIINAEVRRTRFTLLISSYPCGISSPCLFACINLSETLWPETANLQSSTSSPKIGNCLHRGTTCGTLIFSIDLFLLRNHAERSLIPFSRWRPIKMRAVQDFCMRRFLAFEVGTCMMMMILAAVIICLTFDLSYEIIVCAHGVPENGGTQTCVDKSIIVCTRW